MQQYPIIREFLDYLSYEKHFSGHTSKCYNADLLQYAKYLSKREATNEIDLTRDAVDGSPQVAFDQTHANQPAGAAVAVDINTQIAHADVTTIRAFLVFLNEQNYSKATVARKLATLRSFYKFLVRRGHIQSSPVTSIRTPKQEKRLPLCLDPEQISTLLNCPDTNTILGARDRAILETIYSSGLRVSELIALDLSDVDFLGEVLHLRGKGKKSITLYITKSTLPIFLSIIPQKAQK